jgi:hypothetical protein
MSGGSVRQFCANAKARLQACGDDDDKRTFLIDHIERVMYDHYDVTVIGSVPVQTTSGGSKLPFRIEGTINIKKVRSEAQRKGALRQWHAEMAATEERSTAAVAIAV